MKALLWPTRVGHNNAFRHAACCFERWLVIIRLPTRQSFVAYCNTARGGPTVAGTNPAVVAVFACALTTFSQHGARALPPSPPSTEGTRQLSRCMRQREKVQCGLHSMHASHCTNACA